MDSHALSPVMFRFKGKLTKPVFDCPLSSLDGIILFETLDIGRLTFLNIGEEKIFWKFLVSLWLWG